MGKALLIIVVGFSTIFGGMMFNITANQQRSSMAVVNHYEKWIARNTMESAMNVSISKLYQDFDWRDGFSDLSFNGATYSVEVTDVTSDSSTEAKKVQVKVTAAYADEVDSTFAIIMQPAYSYYHYGVHNWPAFRTYDNGDTLRGPVHANAEISLSNSPVFLDKVSSHEQTYLGVSSPDPKFYGGVDFGTPTIELPNLTPLIDSTNAGGDVFSDELWLTFKADGSYDYETDGVASGNRLLSETNGTIMTTANNDIHVKGIVDGAVTILSANDIFVADDLVYASDPEADANCDDYLGLIAQRHIVVPDSAISDIEIHAVLFALDEFQTENYSSGPARGTLRIVGSLLAQDDTPSGTFSGGVLQNGFERIHVHDSRLRDKTPPFFPRLNRVEILFRGD